MQPFLINARAEGIKVDSFSKTTPPTLQHLAASALRGASDHSPLTKTLRRLEPKRLQELICSPLSAELARDVLQGYWHNKTGLCASYSPGERCYRLHYLAPSPNGIVIERSACPADAKLGTLLRLVREAEQRHFLALTQKERVANGSEKIEGLPYTAERSSLGYEIRIGPVSAQCPVQELIPETARFVAARYLEQLQELIGLADYWSLEFCDKQTIQVQHADAPGKGFEIAWRPNLQQCADNARGVIEQAYAELIDAWLPSDPTCSIRYEGHAADGRVILKYTLITAMEQSEGWEYRQLLPFRRAAIAERSTDVWPQVEQDLKTLLLEVRAAIQSCIGGLFTWPLKIEDGKPSFDLEFCNPESRQPPDFDRAMRSWDRSSRRIPSFAELTEAKPSVFTDLMQVCQQLNTKVCCLDDLERICLQLIVGRIEELQRKKRSDSVCRDLPGFDELQVQGSLAEGYCLRIGRRTRAATLLDGGVWLCRLADLDTWVAYSKARRAENKAAKDTLLQALPHNVRALEADRSLCGAIRWSLLRRPDMDDVALLVRYRHLPREIPETITVLNWDNPDLSAQQADVAIATTASLRRCLLGGPIGLNLHLGYADKPLLKNGVNIRLFNGQYQASAKSLVWPGKTFEELGYGLRGLWKAIADIQVARHNEIRKLWKRSALLGRIWVPAGWEGHYSVGISGMDGKLRPMIKEDGSLWVSAWRGSHNDGFYYREYPLESVRSWTTLAKARAWTLGKGEALDSEALTFKRLEGFYYDREGLDWSRSCYEIPELEPQYNRRYEN